MRASSHRPLARLPKVWPTIWLTCLWSTLAGAAAIEAQFRQYTPPGDLQGIATPRRQGIERDVEKARWRLGAVRVQPQLSLRNFSYLDNVFAGEGEGTVSDFTASVGAGLRAYLPLGRKSTLAAYALPEYVWWQDLEDRRRLNERYGAGLFSYFNRLTIELEAISDEYQGFASNELEQVVTRREDRLGLTAEVTLRRSLAAFSEVSSSRFRYLAQEERDDPRVLPFDRLDRDEDVARVGLRVRIEDAWNIAVGLERSEVSFRNSANDLSNEGTAPFLTFEHQGRRQELVVDLALRSLEGREGSTFTEFDEVTGRVELGLRLRPRLSVQAYGRRNLTYSVTSGFSFATDTRAGLSLKLELGRAAGLRAFAEEGTFDYAGSPRQDDVEGWGAQFEVELRQRWGFQLGWSTTDVASNFAGFDRSTSQLTATLTFGDGSWP